MWILKLSCCFDLISVKIICAFSDLSKYYNFKKQEQGRHWWQVITSNHTPLMRPPLPASYNPMSLAESHCPILLWAGPYHRGLTATITSNGRPSNGNPLTSLALCFKPPLLLRRPHDVPPSCLPEIYLKKFLDGQYWLLADFFRKTE